MMRKKREAYEVLQATGGGEDVEAAAGWFPAFANGMLAFVQSYRTWYWDSSGM